MRKILILWTIAIALSSSSALAESIKVGVDGMVCAFCAKGIEESFSKVESVEKATVNMDDKSLTLQVHKGKQLSDEVITKTIIDAGYTVRDIQHIKE
jgi:mercuric ion binding protein